MIDPKVLLLTSAINPSVNMVTADPEVRIQQTLDSLSFLYNQNVFDKVILIDSSGFDLMPYISKKIWKEGWIETYNFFQDTEKIKEFGYGYGESIIYKEAARILEGRVKHIYKISGRYRILNLEKIVTEIVRRERFFFTFYPRYLEYRKYVHTAFFKMPVNDLIDAGEFCEKYTSKKKWAPLEEAVYNWIETKTDKKKWLTVPLPKYEGVSGLTGRRIENYRFPYSVFVHLDFLPLMGFTY